MHKKLIPDTPVIITKRVRVDNLWSTEMAGTINKVGIYTGMKDTFRGHNIYQIVFDPGTLSSNQIRRRRFWYYCNEFEYYSIGETVINY